MPNFIHSLDASNVHLLLDSISKHKLPVYTVHDCFAGSSNNMFTLERLVKEAFIEIYFNNEGYLLKIHHQFVEDILSATDPFIDNIDNLTPINSMTPLNNDNLNIIDRNNNAQHKQVINRITREIISIPNLPTGFEDRSKNINEFIKGLLNSKYFIG
jgi:DNA-directed RNA polymerase